MESIRIIRIMKRKKTTIFFDKLTDLLQPPSNVDSNSIEKNIEFVEKHYKLKFPKDYIQFIATYGSGQIDEFISIYSIINSPAYYEMIERECQCYRNFKEMFSKEYQHNIFPEKDGLYPLGRTDGGCLIWWQTALEPEDWVIVVYDENSWEYEEYDMQLCEFLYKYFTKQINCKGFPDSLREAERPYFVPNEFDFKRYCE